MAFVSREDRFAPSRRTTSIGPGSYLGQTAAKTQRSHAPFSSRAERSMHSPRYTPGPGSYSLAKLPDPLAQSASGKDKLSGPFASRDSRFKSEKPGASPGPGSYDAPADWSKPRKQPVKQDWNTMNWLRLPSAPSIPAQNQAFGYDETNNGELVMQKNPEKVHAGTAKDSVGPGQYNARKPEEIWTNKGTAWYKYRGKRHVSTAPNKGNLGPGAYNEFQLNLAPMYKYRPNAIFVSKTHRDVQVQDTNAEDTQETKPELPGPGQYYTQAQSDFRPKKVPASMQFFGSTSARFPSKPPPNPALGPGVYGELRKPLLPKPVSDLHVPFSSKHLRFAARPNTSQGPGSYKERSFSEETRRKVHGQQGAFGSTEKRFLGYIPPPRAPGPGHYPANSDRKIGSHNSAKRKEMSVFASSTTREGGAYKSDAPAPGHYSLKSDFSAERSRSGVTNPLLAAKTEKHTEVPFHMKSARFRPSEPPVTLGPGSYDPKSGSLHPVFLPKAPRFSGKSSANPGPGTYEDDHESKWNKRSYNLLYTEYV